MKLIKSLVIGSSLFCSLLAGMSVALQAPFFPKECDTKGIPASVYGFIFGIYELVALLVSVPVGASLHSVGAKYCLLFGVFVLSISMILFGLLAHISDTTIFIAYAFMIRIVEAIGSICVNTAGLTALVGTFPAMGSFLASWFETFYGIGLALGPPFGGFLYDLRGFSLPFEVVGVLCFFSFVSIWILLPGDQTSIKADGMNDHLELSIVLKEPRVWCAVLANALCSMGSFGFLDVTLEPHLRQINPSGTYTGLAFLWNGLGYTIFLPFWGKFADKTKRTGRIIISAALIMMIGLALVGPFPWTPFKPAKTPIMIGVTIVGIGMGGVFIPTLTYIKTAIFGLGYEDDERTTGTASGIWLASSSLGGFVGPSLSGILYDYFDFRISSFFMIIFHFIVVLILLIFEADDGRRTTRVKRRRVTFEQNVHETAFLITKDDKQSKV